MRKIIRIATLSVLVTVMTAQAALGVMIFDPANVTKSINLATGRVYVSYNDGPPIYDVPTDTYHVPAVIGEEVSVPDPVAAAKGDATPKTKIVGNQVVMKLPGTDIVKLANGLWTNVYPSATLTEAQEYASTESKYDNKSVIDCVKGTLDGGWINYDCGSGNLLNADTYYRLIVPDSQFITLYYITPESTFSTGSLYNGTCPVGPFHLISNNTSFVSYYSLNLAYCNQVDATHYTVTSPSNQLNVSYDPLKYDPSITNPTSSQIAEKLEPSQSGWKENGLAEDYKKAAENGTPTIVGNGPSQGDIQAWKDANGKAVEESIFYGIDQGGTTLETDGSGTGAQQQQTGQLAGIQNTLNKIKDELTKDNDTVYSPSEIGSPYTLLEVDFGARLTEFTDSVKSSSLFSLPNSAFNVPGGGSSQLTINGGATFGVQTVDLADMSSFWSILKAIVLCCFSFVGVRIVCLKGGSQ